VEITVKNKKYKFFIFFSFFNIFVLKYITIFTYHNSNRMVLWNMVKSSFSINSYIQLIVTSIFTGDCTCKFDFLPFVIERSAKLWFVKFRRVAFENKSRSGVRNIQIDSSVCRFILKDNLLLSKREKLLKKNISCIISEYLPTPTRSIV